MPKTAVILPAAGSSSRFGGQQSKIFARIGEQAMLLRTCEAFSSRKDVIQLLVAVSASDLDAVREKFGGHLSFLGAELLTGGRTRTETVRLALEQVSDEAELVAVHDAARPCVAQPWIDAVFDEAAKTGAAILALPVVGTIKRVAGSGVIDATLPREEFADLWEAQTPQVFRVDVLRKAYATGGEATDDAALVEATGHPVSVVAGDARNIKVTTKRDLGFAAAVIKTLPRGRTDGLLHPFAEGPF